MQLLKHQWAYPRGISLLAAENVKTCTTKLSVGVCFVSVVEDLSTYTCTVTVVSYTSVQVNPVTPHCLIDLKCSSQYVLTSFPPLTKQTPTERRLGTG